MENPILHTPQIQSLSPNVLPQTLQNFTVKFCVYDLDLGDEFVMNNAVDVEKHDEHGLCLSCSPFSPSSVVEMMGSSIATTLSQGRTCGLLFHLSVHYVTRRLPHTRGHKNTNTTTPDVNTAMSFGTLPYQD
jgi:hypothetical protein